MPLPILAEYPAGLRPLGGSAFVALDAWPDLGCLMLAAFVIPTALIFHRCWEIPPGEAAQNLNFNEERRPARSRTAPVRLLRRSGIVARLHPDRPLVSLSSGRLDSISP
jgi:hypothetical protein